MRWLPSGQRSSPRSPRLRPRQSQPRRASRSPPPSLARAPRRPVSLPLLPPRSTGRRAKRPREGGHA
eukprot:1648423-Alexandrium_andersonii.AAC.1